MPHQAPLNRDSEPSPAAGVRQGLAGLLHDLTALVELQFQLLAVDAESASRRAVVPFLLLGAAAVFGLSALPLLLLAFAQLLRDQAGWPAALATLAAVAVGLVVAGLCTGLAYVGLRRCLEPLARSRDELRHNVEWLKAALKRQELQRHAAASVPPHATIPPNQPR
jgi:hypothetical protein